MRKRSAGLWRRIARKWTRYYRLHPQAALATGHGRKIK